MRVVYLQLNWITVSGPLSSLMQFRSIIFKCEWPFIKCLKFGSAIQNSWNITETSSLQPLKQQTGAFGPLNGRMTCRMGEWITTIHVIRIADDFRPAARNAFTNLEWNGSDQLHLTAWQSAHFLLHYVIASREIHLILHSIVKCWQIWGH